jgi:competence protein ComEC
VTGHARLEPAPVGGPGGDGRAGVVCTGRLDVRLGAFAVAVWGSTLLSLRGSAVAAVVAAAGVVAVAVAGSARWRAGPAGRVLAVLGLGTIAAAGCTGFAVAARDSGPVATLAARRATVEVELVVRDDPRRARSAPAGRPTYVVPAALRRLTVAGRGTPARGRVVVFATDPGWAVLLPGQPLVARGRLAPPRDRDLTIAVLSARGAPRPRGRPPWYQRGAGGLRAGLQRACAGLPPDRGGLLPGLAVGDTSRLEPAVEEAFRQTGMSHLLAVSGSNTAVTVGAVLLLLRWVRAGPRVAPVLAGVALAGFVVLARPSPSVVRAAVMGAIVLVGLATGRPRAALPALAGAVAVLLLLDPALAVSPGFTLSVLATLGLVVLAPRWRDRLRARGVPPVLAEALAVAAAAQVSCAVVLAGLSGGVGLVAVPANLLAAPAVVPVTVLGVLAAAVSPVVPAAAAALAWLASWPAAWLITVARAGAAVPGGTLPWPGGLWGGLALGVVLVVVVLACRRQRLRQVMAATAMAVVLVALPIRLVAPGWPPAGWRVVGCAVGQGDVEVLRAGPAAAVVVDAGPDAAAADACLSRLGVRTVPLLVLSHLHLDHVGGVAGVLRGRRVGAVLSSGYALPLPGARLLAEVTRQRGVPVLRVGPGAAYRVGDVRLEVVGPVRRFAGTRSDPNNNSLVLRADVGGLSVLLTGDVEHDAQDDLLARGVPRRVDVLKVPHHGSSFSDPAFLDATRPGVAIVEVGAGNDYGHPSPVVTARLARHGARVLRTDLDGDVAVLVRDGQIAVAVRGPARTARSP